VGSGARLILALRRILPTAPFDAVPLRAFRAPT
jgi:hypothetical protein